MTCLIWILLTITIMRTHTRGTLHTCINYFECKYGVLFEALPYIVYIRERYFFSLLRTFKKSTKNFEVYVDSQKGAPRFRGKIDNKCATPNMIFSVTYYLDLCNAIFLFFIFNIYCISHI